MSERHVTLGRMMRRATIFVELTSEAVDDWRAVVAVEERPGVYRLPREQLPGESWAFAPGSRVRCESRVLSGQRRLVVSALAV